jgi:DNA-binding transcriptional LysR family regulator
MKIHQVCYFLALCEERSFTRAAKRCGVAQPSLTRAIQQLEHEFNGQLFERSKSAVRLTNLGILVRPDFVRIEQAVAEVTQKIATFNAARTVDAHTNTGDTLCERQR